MSEPTNPKGRGSHWWDNGVWREKSPEELRAGHQALTASYRVRRQAKVNAIAHVKAELARRKAYRGMSDHDLLAEILEHLKSPRESTVEFSDGRKATLTAHPAADAGSPKGIAEHSSKPDHALLVEILAHLKGPRSSITETSDGHKMTITTRGNGEGHIQHDDGTHAASFSPGHHSASHTHKLGDPTW